nr:MAG TPA: hypothetical protein [Microviridae sp.]
MGITAIISGILAILSTIGGVTSSQLQKKDDRDNVNGLADSGASKGVSIASDITGMASQMLSFVDGFGSMGRLPSTDKIMNSNAIGQNADKILKGFTRSGRRQINNIISR